MYEIPFYSEAQGLVHKVWDWGQLYLKMGAVIFKNVGPDRDLYLICCKNDITICTYIHIHISL